MRVALALALLAGTAAADPARVEVALEGARAALPGAAACADVPCLIDRAYRADERARAIAQAMWAERGDVVGVGPDEIMDGGYRGQIHLVPQLPIGRYRPHLAWIAEATAGFDRFFAQLFADREPPAYRWHGLTFQVVRSVGKRTPSAFATGWRVGYNVEGSLLTSAGGVAETLFHELFHTNDEAHAGWSGGHLRADYDAIVRRCGTAVACLAPFAPNDTRVRGGTYYAFQPRNGDSVHEYAAELAVRYWKEQREVLAAGKLARRAFKCGPAENARAWQALVDEFFAGRDLVPACAPPP
jgi:hypothetical protein